MFRVGLGLVAATLLAAVVVGLHRDPTTLDHWGFAVVGPTIHSKVLSRTVDIGVLGLVTAGSVLAGLVVVRHDRRRAASCVLGPFVAAALVDWMLKPLVGRRYDGVLCFPSGTVTVMASLATSWALAVSPHLRWPVIVAGSVVVAAVSWAVIGLRWHYPSDVVAGWAFGVGVVLLLDGTLHRWSALSTRG